MNNFSLVYENEIKRRINWEFPGLRINVYFDEEIDNVIISIANDVIFYSDVFQNIVMDIKLNVLWPNNINNYLFVLTKENEYAFSTNVSVTSSIRVGELSSWIIEGASDEYGLSKVTSNDQGLAA